MENREINLGRELLDALTSRTRLTGRSRSAELCFVVGLGLAHISPSEIYVASTLPGEPRRSFARAEIWAPAAFWRTLAPLAERLRWVRNPDGWRGYKLLLHGRPSQLSRAVRIALVAGLEALESRPDLDPIPAQRRAYTRALARAYGDWRVKPESDTEGSEGAAESLNARTRAHREFAVATTRNHTTS